MNTDGEAEGEEIYDKASDYFALYTFGDFIGFVYTEQLMPGSPFNDEKLNADQKAALYAKYGLDQPIMYSFLNM